MDSDGVVFFADCMIYEFSFFLRGRLHRAIVVRYQARRRAGDWRVLAALACLSIERISSGRREVEFVDI